MRSETFSSSETLKGSSSTAVSHVSVTGSTSARRTGSRGSRDAAPAISTAKGAGRPTSPRFSPPAGGAKPPEPAGQDADADAIGPGSVDPLHLLVLHGDGFVLLQDPPGVGVVGPGLAGRLHRLSYDLEHRHPTVGRTAGSLPRPGDAGNPQIDGRRTSRREPAGGVAGIVLACSTGRSSR